MSRFRLVLPALLACLSLAGAAYADAVPGPAATVDAFHAALKSGQPQAALNLLTQNVVIAEQGFIDEGRDTYARTQAANDVAFAKATDYQVLNRHLIWLGDAAALVISQTRTTGSFAGHAIDLLGAETVLLRQYGGRWQIDHIHWSAHPEHRDAGAAK